MFDRYFGMPQHVIRSGLWARMKPSQQSLYVCLMHESERCSTRQMRRNDGYLCELSGLSSRAFCDARKKLQELGLVQCRRGAGNIYVYTVCNPETGTPWPGAPKERFLYRKKEPSAENERRTSSACTDADVPAKIGKSPQTAPLSPNNSPLKSYGIRLKF